ncbi:unnamed protein product, partial [Mesorhabditis belari]|uniref:Uncharacterized protein n=1 Tax=Mesorhabditis belari TaxID=2138241 RepID=A0AAF3F9V2_9BILA
MELKKIPRRSDQIFVFSIREAAQRVEKPKVPDYFFNASLSYLSTADIPYNHRYEWMRKDESEKR